MSRRARERRRDWRTAIWSLLAVWRVGALRSAVAAKRSSARNRSSRLALARSRLRVLRKASDSSFSCSRENTLSRFTDDGALGRARKDWTVSPDRLSTELHTAARTSPFTTAPRSTQNDRRTACQSPTLDLWARISTMSNRSAPSAIDRARSCIQRALTVHARSAGDAVSRSQGTRTSGPALTSRRNPRGLTEMRANPHYYLGAPNIDRIVINTYPTGRAAWADMLRGRTTFFVRGRPGGAGFAGSATHIRYVQVHPPVSVDDRLQSGRRILRSTAVRKGLNAAVDRARSRQERRWAGRGAVRQPGLATSLGISDGCLPRFEFTPIGARRLTRAGCSRHEVHFTCLVPESRRTSDCRLRCKRQLRPSALTCNCRSRSR